HQNYARRNGLKYSYYRWSCGRDRRLNQVWGARARSGSRWLARGEVAAVDPKTQAKPQSATASKEAPAPKEPVTTPGKPQKS
ncbi:MAG: hypothetical protein ACK40D_04715, partial [Cyanobacteriota bacterium]